MTRDEIISDERIYNLSDALIAVLNSDTESSAESQFDQLDHITALSLVICFVATRLGLDKATFLTGVDRCFDVLQTKLEVPNETNH